MKSVPFKLIVVCCALLANVLLLGTGFAESLYVTDHGANVFSFDVINGTLQFRKSLTVPRSGGGIDLAIDNDNNILFRNVEFDPEIEIIEARSLNYIKTITLPVLTDAGIVYDSANSRLLCTRRNSNLLYIFSWDPVTQTLTYQQPSITLSEIQDACDLAIKGNILYISQYSYSGVPSYKEICAYDMSNGFTFIEKINMDHPVVSMDYNASDDSLYGGAWSGHQNIAKRTLDPNTLTYGDVGTPVTGIATSNVVAGRVFFTSYRYGGAIESWDASNSDPTQWELVDDYTNDNPDNITLDGLAGLTVGENFIIPLTVSKESDYPNECISPGETLNYRLCVTNHSEAYAATAVELVDYLPAGMNVVSANPVGSYDPNTHSYEWDIGSIPPSNTNCVDLTVSVNTATEPGMKIRNEAYMYGTIYINDPNGDPVQIDGLIAIAKEDTPVCCWGDDPTMIFVDITADGNNTGTDWQNAYSGDDALQKALYRAENSTCTGPYKILVAKGTYTAGDSDPEGFLLPDGISLYGGFPSGGAEFNQRSPRENEAILYSQYADPCLPDSVVTMGNLTLLEGVTVTGASSLGYGIYGEGVDFEIENCTIIDNENRGISAKDSNVTVKWCDLKQNGRYAIYHEGAGSTLTVENCQIMKNQRFGIACQDSTPIVKNSIISESDLDRAASAGIAMFDPADTPILHNNTIAHNKDVGIYLDGSNEPDVQNCILWYNNNDANQCYGLSAGNISYSCIYDPNNPDGISQSLGNFNFSTKPEFAYIDPNSGLPSPNNMHIEVISPCKEAGNPTMSYVHQVDMDKKSREDGIVDVGAYEVRCGVVANELDWNTDGLVNLDEFSLFASNWYTTRPVEPDPDWERCNLDNTGASAHIINLADLAVFCEDYPQNWLWKACWVNDYDCADSVNTLDYDGDGQVNMVEYSLFASVWQNTNINDPIVEFFNLDNTGASENIIDISDFVLFLDDWLWLACWKEIDDGCTNPLDWNDDGFVNYEEFSRFQAAWLSQDGGLNWNPVCDLDDSGAIDMGDVMIFLNDWLWISCEQRALMTVPQQDDPLQVLSEEVSQLQTNIGLLDTLWQTDPNMQQQFTAEEWQVFMDTLYEELTTKTRTLYELQTGMSMIDQVLGLQSDIAMLEDLWLTDPDIQQQIDPADWQTLMDSLYQQLDVLMSLLTEEELMFLEMLGGQQQSSMMEQGSAMLTSETMTLTEPETVTEDPVVQLADNIELLETIWAEDDQIQEVIDAKDWKEFMGTIYDELEYQESLQSVQ